MVLVVLRCYGQNGPNLAKLFLSTTLQVPKLDQQKNKTFERWATWFHLKSSNRSCVMNFPFLKIPKVINHKLLVFFEFRQLQHLLEILLYSSSDFECGKVQEKLRLAWLWWFGGAMAKTGQTLPRSSFLQLCKFRKLTNSKTIHLKGDPLDFTQKAPLVPELWIFPF